MNPIKLYLGLDVHKNSIVVAAALADGSAPLSPLLANILLDDLDNGLEKRGHTFARYADDFDSSASSGVLTLRAALRQSVSGLPPPPRLSSSVAALGPPSGSWQASRILLSIA